MIQKFSDIFCMGSKALTVPTLVLINNSEHLRAPPNSLSSSYCSCNRRLFYFHLSLLTVIYLYNFLQLKDTEMASLVKTVLIFRTQGGAEKCG